MFSKRNVMLSAKISLCAMLMMLTASVASASTSAVLEAGMTPIGTVYANGGSTNNLALEFLLPDAYNNAAAIDDTQLYDGVLKSWNGDQYTIWLPDEFYMDTNSNDAYDAGEAIIEDVNTDGILDPFDNIHLEGTAPWQSFQAAVAGAEYWFDGTIAPTAGSYDGVEAIWIDSIGNGQMDGGDWAIIGGATSYMNFNSPPGSAIGPPADIQFANNLLACDNGNGVYDFGEPIWADILGGPTAFYDPGFDTILYDPGNCLIGVGAPFYMGASFSGIGVEQIGYLDSNHNGIFDYVPAPAGPGGFSEPIMRAFAPYADGANITGGGATDTVLQPYAAVAGELGISGDYIEDWYLMSSDNNYYFERTGGTAGFSGDESVAHDDGDGILESGEVVVGGVVGPTDDMDQTWGTVKHTSLAPFATNKDVYDDLDNDGFVDKAADELMGITLKNSGTLTQTYIPAVMLWADGGNATFEAGGDDTLLGAGTWDSTDNSWEWDWIIGVPIPLGGREFYASVNLAAAVPDNSTVKLYVPQFNDDLADDDLLLGSLDEGIFMASLNHGPTDANAVPTSTNQLLTPDTGGGGGGSGGSSGGSSAECGDGTKDTGEACDDGNTDDDDGCSATCTLEEGYVWDTELEEVVVEGEETTAEEGETLAGEGTLEEPTDLTADEVAYNFSDYDAAFWASEYIALLFNAGIMTGPGDGTFGVAVGTTRAEIVKIALLANGIEVPESVDEAPFLDTPLTEWYTTYVAKAAELGIVDGYDDGNFRPGNMVNRAEALKILLLAKGVDLDSYDLSSVSHFSDVSETIWYAVYVAYGYDMGIIEGYEDGTFKAINDILRGEIAKITVVIMDLVLEV
ncbi:S-layer homology domain-containing protein [Patescibacteria group bacterium]